MGDGVGLASVRASFLVSMDFFCDRFLWNRDLTRDLGSAGPPSMMELLLSMDTPEIKGKLAYKLIKRTKSKDYPNRNM